MKKAYEMIIESGMDVYKMVRPADNEKKLRSIYGGNGDFVRIKEVTKDYPIDLGKVRDALYKAQFGEPEADIIISILQEGYEGAL